ncbi:MAG: hypothetical protein IPG77_01810 [Betaproteobacteria bacterium]|nr:hypothetical protein [Betaproteobacteria bacterium]
MNETQRAAAERLADDLQRFDGAERESLRDEAAALLRELAAEPVQEPVGWLHDETGDFEPSHKPWMDDDEEWVPLYAAPQQPMRCPEDGGECGAGGYCRPEQRKPLTPSMQAEVECDCLVAWNASTYGHSAQDTVHPMFLSAFLRGYRAAERAHGITGEPT